MDNLDPKGLRQKFARGSRAFKNSNIYRTDSEWEHIVLTKFKRRVIGFCRNENTKSLDGLAKILSEMKIVDSKDEGKSFARQLYGKRVLYRTERGNDYYLFFQKVVNKDGQEGCRFEIYAEGPTVD